MSKRKSDRLGPIDKFVSDTNGRQKKVKLNGDEIPIEKLTLKFKSENSPIDIPTESKASKKSGT